jgi:two-component system, LytTR family, sensor kinase
VRVTPAKLRRIGVAYLRSFACWLPLSALISFQQYLIEIDLKHRVPFLEIQVITAIRFVVYAILTPPVFFIVRRFPIQREKTLRGILFYVFGAAGFIISYAVVRVCIAPLWDVEQQRFMPRGVHELAGVIYGTFGDQLSVYFTLVAAAHAYEYFRRVRAEERERGELRRALAATELQALRSQLHPHFLFNTLHGISTLIDSDQELAKRLIFRLSSLLRTVLQHSGDDLISLQDELAFIEAYLELEKMRLGARLEVRWKISPDTTGLLVPHLILQPLVENAVLHGIANCRDGGWLSISAVRKGEAFQLQIENSIGGQRKPGIGLGLMNVRNRLKFLYMEDAEFSFELDKDRIATARIVIPALDAGSKPLPG